MYAEQRHCPGQCFGDPFERLLWFTDVVTELIVLVKY